MDASLSDGSQAGRDARVEADGAMGSDGDIGTADAGDGATVSMDATVSSWSTIQVDLAPYADQEVTTQFSQWFTITSSDSERPIFVATGGSWCDLSVSEFFSYCHTSGECEPQVDITIRFTRPVRDVSFELGCVNDEGYLADLFISFADGSSKTEQLVFGPEGHMKVTVGQREITQIELANVTDRWGFAMGALGFSFPE